MKSKVTLLLAVCVLGLTLSHIAVAQRGNGGAGNGNFAQPAPPREYSVTDIPGVVAAGTKWQLVWGGSNNADGLVGTADGGVLFAQEQPNRVSKIDKDGKVSTFLENTHGTGSVGIDAQGRVLAVARTCTDPGGHPNDCKEATAVVFLTPEYKVIADSYNGMGLGRLNDLVIAKNDGVYFNGNGTYYVDPTGKVSSIGDMKPTTGADGMPACKNGYGLSADKSVCTIRTNGIILSRDEKTLYVTSGGGLVAFDIQADGSATNGRDFAKFANGGGDGSTIDSEGRVYVTTNAGVQVVGPDGKVLGVIPTPRPVISVAFSGPDKKTLYAVGSGATGPDGQEMKTADGVRNNAKSIFKISMIAQGFKGRAK